MASSRGLEGDVSRPACATSPSRKTTCSGSPGLHRGGDGDDRAVGAAGQAVAAVEHRQRRRGGQLGGQRLQRPSAAAESGGGRGAQPPLQRRQGRPLVGDATLGVGPQQPGLHRAQLVPPAAHARRGGRPRPRDGEIVEHLAALLDQPPGRRAAGPAAARAAAGSCAPRPASRGPAAAPAPAAPAAGRPPPAREISAAAEGVGARRSATKSAMVKSVSWPTPEITGTRQAAMARASPSSLKHHRSSAEPPPRARITTSTSGTAATDAQRRHDGQGRALPLDGRGGQQDRHREPPVGHPDDVADDRPARRGHDPDPPRQEGQGALSLGREQPLGRQLALQLLEGHAPAARRPPARGPSPRTGTCPGLRRW